MTDLTLNETTLNKALMKSGRHTLYFLRIEGKDANMPAFISNTGTFNTADIIIDAGELDEFNEDFESNWDYRQRAERIAQNWMTKHEAKSVKLFGVRCGKETKLLITYTQNGEA